MQTIHFSHNLYRELFLLLNIPVEEEDFLYEVLSAKEDNIGFSDIIAKLTDWNIAHVVTKSSALTNKFVPTPIIIKKKYSNAYYLVVSLKGAKCTIYNPQTGKKVNTLTSLILSNIEPWVILVEKTTVSAQTSLIKSRKARTALEYKKYLIMLLILSFSLIVMLIGIKLSVYLAGYFISSTIGLYFSIILARIKSSSSGLEILKHICTLASDRDGCSIAVLSDYGTIFGIGLPYIGITHFSVSLIVLLKVLVMPTYVGSVSVGNLYWIYSMVGGCISFALLFIQLKVIKQFCLLCCGVLFILVTQAVIVHFFAFELRHLPLESIVTGFLIGVILSFFIYQSILEVSISKEKYKLQKVLQNQSIFTSILGIDSGCDYSLPKSQLLINYNPEAKHLISIIIVDGCKHCQNFLQALINITLISEEYNLAVAIKNPSEAVNILEYKRTVLQNYYKKVIGVTSFTINWRNNILTSYESVDKVGNDLPHDKFLDCVESHNMVIEFPHIEIMDRKIPMIYNPDQLKRHIIMAKYTS